MILDLLAIAGCTMIITKGFIFKSLREAISRKSDFFGKLFNCPMCMSLWVSIIFIIIPENIKIILHYPFIGSLFTYTIYLVIERVKLK